MSKVAKTENKSTIELRAIELLKASIDVIGISDFPITNFKYDINAEIKIDDTNKLLFCVISIDVSSEKLQMVLGGLVVSCIYYVSNFDEVIKPTEANSFSIPPQLQDMLNTISISTARGVMFSTFKGTVLHGAVLPIVYPQLHKAE
jgi:hypothetical protein